MVDRKQSLRYVHVGIALQSQVEVHRVHWQVSLKEWAAKWLLTGLLMLVIIVSAGCAGTQPAQRSDIAEFHAELPDVWAIQPDTADVPLSRHFMEIIDDQRLRDLVAEAMAANPDLRASAHRLEASIKLLTETKAIRWPLVDVGYTAVRSNQGVNAFGERVVETQHRASLNVAWEVDVWRRLSDLHSENTALTASQAADFASARDALGARVIQAWVAAISVQQALRLEEERVGLLVQLEESIQHRYRRGIGTLDDLAAARTSTELARSTVVALQEEHNQSIRVLELLLGRLPRTALLTADSLPVIEHVSAGYPVAAMAQRHDVRAALWRLEAADAAAAAAAKAMLPSLRLTSDVAKNKTALAGLLGAKNIWSIAGSFAQPVFQRGLLKARSDARRFEVEAAWEVYRSTVLQAVGEIEDGLGREHALIGQRNHLANALQSSIRNTQIQEERYRRGLASIQELLLARNQEMNIRRQVLALDGDVLSNRIHLALAVGAGFGEQPL